MYKKILLLIFCVVAQHVSGLDMQITAREVSSCFAPEYNKAFDFCWTLSGIGAVQLNNRHIVKGGLALGSAGNTFDIKGFAGGEAALPVNLPLYVSLAYNYNGLPEYEAHTHSILPLLSLKWRRAGFSLGNNFRLTSFFGESPIFEPVLSAIIYVNIINNNFMLIGLKLANIDDFTYGNFGSYFFALNSVIRLSRNFSIVNDIELRQSGSVALTSNFYGIVYRGGLAFLW